jgi:hypothetical protein
MKETMPEHLPKYRAAALAAWTPLFALAMAGCGSRDGEPSTRVLSGSTVNYGSFGTSADLDCGRGNSLTVTGSNNTLKVAGACSSVRVSGADNTIALVQVDVELAVDGLNNTVTYKAGEPAVEDSGSGNRIGRG